MNLLLVLLLLPSKVLPSKEGFPSKEELPSKEALPSKEEEEDFLSKEEQEKDF